VPSGFACETDGSAGLVAGSWRVLRAGSATARTLGGLEEIGQGCREITAEGRALEWRETRLMEPSAESVDSYAPAGNRVVTVEARRGPGKAAGSAVGASDDGPVRGENVAAPGVSAGGGLNHVGRPIRHPHILNNRAACHKPRGSTMASARAD
jgi:hypothetical protein